MVSYSDYHRRHGLLDDRNTIAEPRRRRFRFFAALAAPFKDMDERALHKKYGPTAIEKNNSKGNLYGAAHARAAVRRFPRADD